MINRNLNPLDQLYIKCQIPPHLLIHRKIFLK